MKERKKESNLITLFPRELHENGKMSNFSLFYEATIIFSVVILRRLFFKIFYLKIY
jgi:hypothetical protein